MRKILYIIIGVAAVILTGCSKEMNDTDPQGKYKATIEAVADYAMAGDEAMTAAELKTRAAATIDRYMIEVYKDVAYTEVANVFAGETTNKATNSEGSFDITLDKGQSYYCLLWADGNASAVYDVLNLKAVSLKAGAKPSEAFHGTLTISEAKPTYSVSLNRAVAHITLKETGTLPAGTMAMKFQQHTTFDVSVANVKGSTAERVESLAVAETAGTKDAPAKIETDAIFVLAPIANAGTTTFTFQYEAEDAFDVADVKIQANYNTNITGHYGGAVTPPAGGITVGDLYPNASTPEGVVFWVDPSDPTKGKIVSLNNSGDYPQWSTDNIVTGATSDDNGTLNTTTITNLGTYTAEKYPAAAACVTKGSGWYLPAKNEIKAMYDWWHTDQITNNSIITNAEGEAFEDYFVLWSSTEYNNVQAWSIAFENGNIGFNDKESSFIVRCIKAF